MLLRRNLVKDTTDVLNVPLQRPQSPIFSLLTPNPRSLAAYCQESGYIVRAVVPPTVPTRRVRVCLHAGNTQHEIDGLVETIDLWLATQLGNGILPSTGPQPNIEESSISKDERETERDENDLFKSLL
jgi:hypothetical protein